MKLDDTVLRERIELDSAPERTCRLLPTLDGWLAVNLARESDVDLLPAWLEDGADEWEKVVADRPTAALVERGVLLGMAVAAPGECTSRPTRRRVSEHGRTAFRVVDLSSMWAGPLCARLLADAGAEVIKVEDPRRPDAMRHGSPNLFTRLHDGATFVELPIDSAELRALLDTADVVIESARPRALPQAGIDREAIAPDTGCVWVSITGYGLNGGNRVAFGDDAAVAGGLIDWRDGEPQLIGDAIADPITGMIAAHLTLQARAEGGGWIVDAGLAPCAHEIARDR